MTVSFRIQLVDTFRKNRFISLKTPALYTKLTDRRLTIEKRLDLVEEHWSKDSKQMLFDWLSGLVVNRKK